MRKGKPARHRSASKPSPALDRFDLYELAVTDPGRLVPFLRAAHGRNPLVLREDFSGSASLAKAWAHDVPRGRSIAVDADAEPLRKTLGTPRLTAVQSDVLRCKSRADVIAATNFPLGYWHTRRELVKYLAHAARCLNPRGIFVADMYGGRDAFTPGTQTQRLRGPHGERIDYTWEQRLADPITHRVLNAIHLRVSSPRNAKRPTRLRNAFTYDWRLWSIPELRDAMNDAGFRTVEIYDRVGGALDHDGNLHVRPVDDGEPLDENYVVYVVGRKR